MFEDLEKFDTPITKQDIPSSSVTLLNSYEDLHRIAFYSPNIYSQPMNSNTNTNVNLNSYHKQSHGSNQSEYQMYDANYYSREYLHETCQQSSQHRSYEQHFQVLNAQQTQGMQIMEPNVVQPVIKKIMNSVW